MIFFLSLQITEDYKSSKYENKKDLFFGIWLQSYVQIRRFELIIFEKIFKYISDLKEGIKVMGVRTKWMNNYSDYPSTKYTK